MVMHDYLICAVPTPISPLMFRRSRNTTLNAGTSFSLICIVNLNVSGVESDFIVQSGIVGPGISDTSRVSVSEPVLVSENTYYTEVVFNYLFEADTGTYSCSVLITSSHSNVVASDTTTDSESINVGRKLAA